MSRPNTRTAQATRPYTSNPLAGGADFSAYLNLAGLVGFWSFAHADYASGGLIDMLATHNLSPTGGASYAQGNLVPYATFDGAAQYFSHVDDADFDITNALTIGGWFKSNVSGSLQVLTAKNSPANRAYQMYIHNANYVQFDISTNGADVTTNVQSAATLAANNWYFVCGRFTPNTEVSIFIGDTNGIVTKTRGTTGVPGTVYNSTSPFYIGRNGDGYCLNGAASRVFLTATPLVDEAIINLAQQGAPLYKEG